MRGGRLRGAVGGQLGVRAWICAGGVAVCTLLALVLLSSDRSVTNDIRGYIAQPRIDLWVAPRGVDNFIRSGALLRPGIAERMQQADGVVEVGRVLRAFATVKPVDGDVSERGMNLMLIAYSASEGMGGPPAFVEGHAPSGDAEVAIDRAAAHRLRVGLGDEVLVNEVQAKVVGITSGTNLIATQFIFCDLAAAGEASGFFEDDYSFLTLRLAEGLDPAEARERLTQAFPAVSFHEVEPFLQNNLVEAMAGFRPFQRLVDAIGILVSVLLVGMLVQGIVVDRERELAVLLALGAPPRRLSIALVVVMLRVVVGGVAAGTVLTALLSVALATALPTLSLRFHWQDPALALALFTVVGLVGCLMPLRKLLRIDPVEAFRP